MSGGRRQGSRAAPGCAIRAHVEWRRCPWRRLCRAPGGRERTRAPTPSSLGMPWETFVMYWAMDLRCTTLSPKVEEQAATVEMLRVTESAWHQGKELVPDA
jgi:hypothetical protein